MTTLKRLKSGVLDAPLDNDDREIIESSCNRSGIYQENTVTAGGAGGKRQYTSHQLGGH